MKRERGGGRGAKKRRQKERALDQLNIRETPLFLAGTTTRKNNEDDMMITKNNQNNNLSTASANKCHSLIVRDSSD